MSTTQTVDRPLPLPWKLLIFSSALVLAFIDILLFLLATILVGAFYSHYRKTYPIAAKQARLAFLSAAVLVIGLMAFYSLPPFINALMR